MRFACFKDDAPGFTFTSSVCQDQEFIDRCVFDEDEKENVEIRCYTFTRQLIWQNHDRIWIPARMTIEECCDLLHNDTICDKTKEDLSNYFVDTDARFYQVKSPNSYSRSHKNKATAVTGEESSNESTPSKSKRPSVNRVSFYNDSENEWPEELQILDIKIVTLVYLKKTKKRAAESLPATSKATKSRKTTKKSLPSTKSSKTLKNTKAGRKRPSKRKRAEHDEKTVKKSVKRKRNDNKQDPEDVIMGHIKTFLAKNTERASMENTQAKSLSGALETTISNLLPGTPCYEFQLQAVNAITKSLKHEISSPDYQSNVMSLKRGKQELLDTISNLLDEITQPSTVSIIISCWTVMQHY